MALKSIQQADKIKNPLLAEDARLILDATNSSRYNGLQLIAGNLAPKLRGKDVAIILGDMQNYDRQLGIKSMVAAGKLANGLLPDEAKVILEGTNSSRTGAEAIIASALAANLDGKALATILGDSANYDRFMGLKALVSAERVGKLNSTDLTLVMQNMGSQRNDVLRLLAPYLSR